MGSSLPMILALSFAASLAALAVLIWALSERQFGMGPEGAEVIFAGEPGPEDPAGPESGGHSHGDGHERRRLDQSGRRPVTLLVVSATVWLLLGSLAGMITSIKFHQPDCLVESAWLTLGRLRPLHLNLVAYGWTSLAGLATCLWLVPRLLRTPLVGGHWAWWGGWLWNGALTVGSVSLLAGASEGQEWLEFPWWSDLMLALAGALMGVPLLLTLRRRQVRHLYVSTWYAAAALLWFPWLFLVANLPGIFDGVSQAIVNWWFAHNVLGLWITPLALAAAYYFIPKVLGVPIHSYQISLVGFWSLALFYSQTGIHHLIGGPVPTWLVVVSIVHSVSMVLPVVAVAINHHLTVRGHFARLIDSPTLRFVVTGSVLYTLVSFQGAAEALRSLNRITHFTHYTVAHAHLGVYGFASFIFFGSFYFLMPRLWERDWPYRWMIEAHYWLVTVGLGTYFVAMTWAGVLQGLALLDPAGGFLKSLEVTRPFLPWRSLGGALMSAGHLVFAVHLLIMGRKSP